MSSWDFPILVPRRDDHGRRDEIWEGLKTQVWNGCQVFEGYHEGPGPFNRSAAINAAAEAAGDWRLAIIADADSLLADMGRLWGATATALRENRLVIPHSRWVNVEEDEADAFLQTAKPPLRWRKDRVRYNNTVSSFLIVPRDVWDAVNGFDERFVGWGFEDNAFMHAVDTMTEGHIRLEGDVYHLAHERPHADVNRQLDPHFIANSNHYRSLYKRTTDATQLRRVISKNRVKL
ncbi:n-acetylglucoseaminyltransferase [Microbacterium phage A3Wally]|nr:n-acetylglucoseaminyltransferase [Microbacterium phage A3Wally]